MQYDDQFWQQDYTGLTGVSGISTSGSSSPPVPALNGDGAPILNGDESPVYIS